MPLQPLADMPCRKKAAICAQTLRAATSHFGKPAIEVDLPDPDYCPEVNIGNGSDILGDNGGAIANEIEEVEDFEGNSDTEENKSVKVAMTRLYDMFVPRGVHKPLIQAELPKVH